MMRSVFTQCYCLQSAAKLASFVARYAVLSLNFSAEVRQRSDMQVSHLHTSLSNKFSPILPKAEQIRGYIMIATITSCGSVFHG